jgi:hypothetical protein
MTDLAKKAEEWAYVEVQRLANIKMGKRIIPEPVYENELDHLARMGARGFLAGAEYRPTAGEPRDKNPVCVVCGGIGSFPDPGESIRIPCQPCNGTGKQFRVPTPTAGYFPVKKWEEIFRDGLSRGGSYGWSQGMENAELRKEDYDAIVAEFKRTGFPQRWGVVPTPTAGMPSEKGEEWLAGFTEGQAQGFREGCAARQAEMERAAEVKAERAFEAGREKKKGLGPDNRVAPVSKYPTYADYRKENAG